MASNILGAPYVGLEEVEHVSECVVDTVSDKDGNLVLDNNPLAWVAGANCLGILADSFLSPQGSEEIAQAKEVCKGCPFRKECEDYAIESGAGGIWGGKTERERAHTSRALTQQALRPQ